MEEEEEQEEKAPSFFLGLGRVGLLFLHCCTQDMKKNGAD